MLQWHLRLWLALDFSLWDMSLTTFSASDWIIWHQSQSAISQNNEPPEKDLSKLVVRAAACAMLYFMRLLYLCPLLCSPVHLREKGQVSWGNQYISHISPDRETSGKRWRPPMYVSIADQAGVFQDLFFMAIFFGFTIGLLPYVWNFLTKCIILLSQRTIPVFNTSSPLYGLSRVK